MPRGRLGGDAGEQRDEGVLNVLFGGGRSSLGDDLVQGGGELVVYLASPLFIFEYYLQINAYSPVYDQ